MGFSGSAIAKILDHIFRVKDRPTFHEGLVDVKSQIEFDSKLMLLGKSWAEFEERCTKKRSSRAFTHCSASTTLRKWGRLCIMFEWLLVWVIHHLNFVLMTVRLSIQHCSSWDSNDQIGLYSTTKSRRLSRIKKYARQWLALDSTEFVENITIWSVSKLLVCSIEWKAKGRIKEKVWTSISWW